MTDLDVTIKRALGDYRKSTSDKDKYAPTLQEHDLSGQLQYNFGIESCEFDPSHLQVAESSNRPNVDDTPNMDIESEAFDKILGLSIEIPSDTGEGTVLASASPSGCLHMGCGSTWVF